MKIPLLCFAFSLPCVLCIIGGEDVQMGDDRTNFVVSLVSNPGNKIFCGGALITFYFVITASSCVNGKKPKNVYGYVDRTKSSDTQKAVILYFDKIFAKEPTGQKQVQNNIALLHLKDKIFTSVEDRVRRIPLPSSSDSELLKNGVDCKVFGWGRTSRSTNEPSKILQETKSTIEDVSSCENHNSDVNASNICTFHSTSSLCDFDEGDPLTSPSGDVLWGIATGDYACHERPMLADVFTRIDNHKGWIEEIIEENSSKRHKPQAFATSTAIIVLLITWLYF